MDVNRIVLDLRPEPAAVGNTVGRLFQALGEEAAPPGRREALEAFFRELGRLVINWMAGAEQAVLRDVHERILDELAELPPSHPANRYLPDGEWLGVQLRGLTVLISIYLKTGNLAKSLAPLSGRRRESWRRALEVMASIQRPVRTGELVVHGVFNLETTANNALHKLAEHGLVEKRTDGAAVTFTLTWAGENATKFLQFAGAEEDNAEDGLDVTTPQETSAGALSAFGFATPEMHRVVGQDPAGLRRRLRAFEATSPQFAGVT